MSTDAFEQLIDVAAPGGGSYPVQRGHRRGVRSPHTFDAARWPPSSLTSPYAPQGSTTAVLIVTGGVVRRSHEGAGVLRYRRVPGGRPGARSAGDDPDAVPAAGSVGEGGGPRVGLHLAVGAGRTDGQRVTAGPEVVRQHPLAPQVGVDLRGQLRVGPVLVVDLDLDPRDAARLGPGHAGDRPPPRAELAQRSRCVDPGGDLD